MTVLLGSIGVQLLNLDPQNCSYKTAIFSASLSIICTVGLLVEAMRKGSWIILDELNLAPTDVLEALNRVCVQL